MKQSSAKNVWVRKVVAGVALLSLLVGPIPLPAESADANVVDEMWLARHDPNVVDTFLTLEETVSVLKVPMQPELPVAEVVPESEPVALIGYTENYSDTERLAASSLLSSRVTPELYSLFPTLPGAQPSVVLLTEQQHPKTGDEWRVRFRTTGTGELRITPVDQATIDDDEFVGLWCGSDERPAQVLAGDVIVSPNWFCNDIATISHRTLKEGTHALKIQLQSAASVAHNGPNTYKVMGFFYQGSTTATFAGNASINAPQPDPADNDLMVAVIAIRPQTDIVTTPSGWTSLGSVGGTDGAGEAADTGSARIYTMYKVADGTEGLANQTFAESGTPSVWGVKIYKFRSASGTYDLATSSISINADTTAMGGTFSNADTNIQAGDSVLLASVSNGDANTGYSGWNITSSGITTWGTVSEILDTTSTTGNDIRFGAAKTYAISGTAHASLTVTITAAVAASGASTVVRIRQGEGANRTDSFVRSCGITAAGSTSVAPVYPELEPGDLLLLMVGTRNSTVTPSTPASWTSLGSYTGGVGTFGADAGNAKVQTFSRIPTTALTGTQSVTITSGNTSVGQICAVHRDGAYSWTTDVDGEGDNSAGTAWSVTGSGIDFDADTEGGDAVVVASAINTDTITFHTHGISASGITFSDFNQNTTLGSATGNDMRFETASGDVSTGSATAVAPTYTMTGYSTTGSSPAGASMIITARGIRKPYDGRQMKLISARIILHQSARIKLNQSP